MSVNNAVEIRDLLDRFKKQKYSIDATELHWLLIKVYESGGASADIFGDGAFSLGAECFRDWMFGIYVDGVYLASRNWKIERYFAEYPDAIPTQHHLAMVEPHEGFSRECGSVFPFGNPMPRMSKGRLFPYELASDAIKAKVDVIVKRLLEKVIPAIIENDLMHKDKAAEELKEAAGRPEIKARWMEEDDKKELV